MTVIKIYKISKRRIKSLCILLFIILFPLIFNSGLFSFINFEKNKNKHEDENNSKDLSLNTSSNHPNNAGDFKYYKNITIDHTKVSGPRNLIDFPVLLSIFDSDLHDNVQPDGDDIAFANNFQWLDHETELFNQNYNSTHAQLIVWIRVPVLSPTKDTIIRMYYGNSFIDIQENPVGVWKNNYVGVWHMKESIGNNYDSALGVYNGVERGNVIQDSPGFIDGANEFMGITTESWIEIINSRDLLADSAFTVEAWFKLDSLPNSYVGLVETGRSIEPDWVGLWIDDSNRITFGWDWRSGGNVHGSLLSVDQWYYAVAVYNGTQRDLYLNGVLDAGPSTGTLNNITQNWWIGTDGNGNYFDGIIDEVKISQMSRSADWINTEYNNKYDPNSFYSVGEANNVYIPSIFDFQYFKEITIDHTKVFGTNNLINFPVLISIFDSDLHDNVQPDGDDIAFNNGTDWLYHEIESFNQNYNSTHAQLIAWVCVPLLSPSVDTIIRMYYGNSTMESQENNHGVWDSNFIGVWHLNEESGPVIDSTLNRNNGDVTGASLTSSAMIDGGYDFVRSEMDYIEMPGTGNEFQLEDFTVEVWMKTPDSTVSNDYYIVTQSLYYDTEAWAINICDDTGHLNEGRFTMKISGDQQTVYSNSEITGNEWHHLVGVRGSSQLLIYIDGLLANSNIDNKPGQFIQSSKNISIGSAITVDTEDFNGIIDEVRISKAARSSDWIKTEYNNQYTPNLFYSLGNAIRVEDDKPLDDYHFNFYKIIKIDHRRVFGSGYLLNFPLLITMFDSDLHSDIQSDADDIAFSLGSIWLDHEIEIFNQNYNGTHAELAVWVRIPQLSTSLDTYIRMYYGNSTMNSRQNPNGVWDTSYKGVWHLSEYGGTTEDSTSYKENGLVTGTVIRPSPGQIGNAYNYGNDGTFNVGDPADGHLDFGTQSFMVSMWINIDASTGTLQIPLYKGATSTFDIGYCFGTPTTGNSLSFHITDGIDNIGSPATSITFDSWAYIIGIVDRANNLIRIYKDGYEVGLGTDISSILSIDGDNEFQCANPTYDFDGLLDEVRVLNITRSNDWIKTEYINQYDPTSFYSIGVEQSRTGVLYSNLQVNSLDLYGNSIPYVNISVYNQTILINNKLTDANGTALFTNLFQGEYNFTATITSDIGNHIEVVNITSEAILINQSFQNVDLICDISSNFLNVVDIDGVAVDSGWIIVGNSTHDLQNCSIDNSGQARFWWLNTIPYQYNYTVYYQDDNYKPNIIKVAFGDITIENSSIQIQAGLTTVDFTVSTLLTKQPVSGVKILLSATSTGKSIVNLTTNTEGKATLRWLNSTGINGNYSLQLEFFGSLRDFNITGITRTLNDKANFTVSFQEEFSIYIAISLADYQTELLSLNPTEYISVEWGTQLKLRMLFNVSKAVGAEELLGPIYCDIMTYKIYKGADLILSGNLGAEEYYNGVHYSIIDTEQLDSDITYLIFISAQKSGYSLPQDLLLQLNILENTLILNQSQNDDSIQSVYWSDSIDFSVKPYGEISESFTIESSIFQSLDHSFRFSLPSINTNWNLTQIVFNIYNISWNVNVSDINLSILDPFGTNRIFNISNHGGWDYNLGLWTGITINLNKGSPTYDNSFEFFISGTFDGTIDVISDAYFIRNSINIQYVKYNISNTISLLSESEGWVVKNITFIIQNCYNTTTWQKVDLSPLTNLNISTIDGFKYSLNAGDNNGTGILTIDDKILYPLDNQYLFFVESNSNIIFDVIIKAEYIQSYYQNQYLETLNISDIQKSIPNGASFQLSLNDNKWKNNYATLLINEINNGSQYFFPSQVAMNITIGGQKFKISNTLLGQGTYSLNYLNRDTLYNAIIETNQPVNFTLSYKISYHRVVYYETIGTISYIIRQFPNIHGTVDYYPDLRYFLQTIDTTPIDADRYTLRLEAINENYNPAIKDLDFIVMKRLTLINGESTISKSIEVIYIKDAINFTFLYTDTLTGAKIIDLKTQYYIWEKYDINGNVTANGVGLLTQALDNSHILDFNTENRALGEYLLIITLEKQNYEYKNAMIRLTIVKRELDYSLCDMFKNYQTNIVQGKILQIKINLTDSTRGGIPLLNATIILTVEDIDYQFTESINGTYILNFPTNNVNAFFTSKTLIGTIAILKEDYISEEFRIAIRVEMPEIFPGMPTFYFLIIIFSLVAVIGSIMGYRLYKHATIPTFIKKATEIEKEIKHGKSISESLLYQTKDAFVGEIVRDKWSNIGLSLRDILNIDLKKSRKLPKTRQLKTKSVRDLKPLGLLLMKWDERIGTELLMKYPENININEKTLMQVYSVHEYSGEKGVINITVESMNILSYYTGPETGYYIILVLNLDDDPDIYEGAMASVAQIIMQNIEDDSYMQMIPSLFQRLSIYPSLTEEQILILNYQDEVKRMIINFLRNYGVISKSELLIWLRDRDLEGIVDLEALLADLIKIDLIKVTSVKDFPSELIFLTKDIFMIRVPPDKLFKDPVNHGLPVQFVKEYKDEVQKRFKIYNPTEEDNVRLLQILIDPQVYEILRLLRTAIVTMKDFEKLKTKGISDIYMVLKKLWDIEMIKVFKDDNNVEYYSLLTDINIALIFPKYLLNNIKLSYEQKSKSDKLLLKNLDILKESYRNLKSAKLSKSNHNK